MENLIQILLSITAIYLVVGVIFSFFFYRKGLHKIDKAAIGSTLGFKVIIFPGILIFWPFLLALCPWHGYQYKPEDGQSPPPFEEKLITYDVRLLENMIWVNPNPHPEGTAVNPAKIKA